jgi:hypothetical protein
MAYRSHDLEMDKKLSPMELEDGTLANPDNFVTLQNQLPRFQKAIYIF